jgi:hypothetical protein
MIEQKGVCPMDDKNSATNENASEASEPAPWRKRLQDMTEAELLAYASGSGEHDPVWKLVLGARETAQMIRAAVFYEGDIDDDVMGAEVSPVIIDRMFYRLDRELEALEEILMRQRRSPSAATVTQ